MQGRWEYWNGSFWERLGVQRCFQPSFPLMFKLGFWVYFTNNGSQASWLKVLMNQKKAPGSGTSSKVLDVRTKWRSWSFHGRAVGLASSGEGAWSTALKSRLRLRGNYCLNKVEVIMGSLLLRQTFTQVPGCQRLSAPLWSSQPAFPGHIDRWFSEAGWRRKTSW